MFYVCTAPRTMRFWPVTRAPRCSGNTNTNTNALPCSPGSLAGFSLLGTLRHSQERALGPGFCLPLGQSHRKSADWRRRTLDLHPHSGTGLGPGCFVLRVKPPVFLSVSGITCSLLLSALPPTSLVFCCTISPFSRTKLRAWSRAHCNPLDSFH